MEVILLMLFIMATFLMAPEANAQLDRQRVVADEPVDNVFWATKNIGTGTVRNLSAGSLNSSVLHTFGLVGGGTDRFFGLDDGANTRLGIEYGFSDRFSAGIGRMTFNKIIDLHSTINILRQTTSGSVPIEIAVRVSSGVNTLSDTGWSFSDRLHFFGSLMVARKFDRLSLQLTPMMTHFNRTGAGRQEQLFGLGLSAQFELNDRLALGGEYLPVLGDRNPSTRDALGVSLNIDSGGHIFQLFFTTSQWHNEPFIMANNQHSFRDGDFRFGFNIHRVFGLRN